VSIYSELLRMALGDGRDGRDQPVGSLVAKALSCRARLEGAATGEALSPHANPADRVGDGLAYDVALVRLCDRLGVEHDLTGDGDGVSARDGAEARLADRLPSIAPALGRAVPEGIHARP